MHGTVSLDPDPLIGHVEGRCVEDGDFAQGEDAPGCHDSICYVQIGHVQKIADDPVQSRSKQNRSKDVLFPLSAEG